MGRHPEDLIVRPSIIGVLYGVAVLVLHLTDRLQTELRFRASVLILALVTLAYYLWIKNR